MSLTCLFSKARFATIVALALLALTPAQAQSYRLTDDIPGMIFGYSSDVPIIKDQSQVATVVLPVDSIGGMMVYQVQAIDGVKVGGRKKSPFRRTKEAGRLNSPAFDLLPGKHTLTIWYFENIWVDQKKGKYARVNPGPIDIEAEFEAGCVYQVKALIGSYNFMGFALDKELTDPSIKERIIEARNKVTD